MVPELYDISRYAPVLAAPFAGGLLAMGMARYPLSTEPPSPRPCAGDEAFRRLTVLSAIVIALWAATAVAGWQLWIVCFVGWTLLALALIDERHFVLPDVMCLPLIIAGLIVAAVNGGLADAVTGAAAGYGAFAAIGWLYRRTRGRDGLGLGDAKLLAAAGAWVGWVDLPAVVLIASVSALAAAMLRGGAGNATPVAFGPYLGFALWLSLLYGPFLL